MDLFEKQVKHYTDKYNDTKKIFDERDYSAYMGMLGIRDKDALKTAFEADNELFEQFVMLYAKIMPGKISCTTYAAAVAKLCEDFGVKYKVYTGFCMPKNYVKYKEDKKAYEDKKKKGVEHPMFPTHVYLETSDKKIYEYYNGDKDIDHIDVVKIA